MAHLVVAGRRRRARQHRKPRLASIKRLDCVFSSTHSTSARSNGFKYNPTTSRTLSTNSGSLDSFHESCLWRQSERPQIRDNADWLIPSSAANDRVDQCVASLGVVSRCE